MPLPLGNGFCQFQVPPAESVGATGAWAITLDDFGVGGDGFLLRVGAAWAVAGTSAAKSPTARKTATPGRSLTTPRTFLQEPVKLAILVRESALYCRG